MPLAVGSSFYTTDHQFISYTDVGKGKPLILIHAFPTDQRLWGPQQEGLKMYFRVITLDLWGFGESSAVNSDGNAVSMTEYADEVKTLMDHLNIDKATLVGESMGGYIALAFLGKYPNQLDGLVLANTQSIADSEETKAAREKIAIDILEHGTEGFINGFMMKALSTEVAEETKALLYHIMSLQKPTAMASALRGMALRHDSSELLQATALPILIITGGDDKVISPQQSRKMHILAKNSQLIEFPRTGHLSNLEQAQPWNEAIITMFLG